MTNAPDQATVLAVIDVLTRALGARILTFAALAMTFALFCWAMRLQSWLAFAIAGAFGLGVLLPVLFINRRTPNG
jgi:hypothetical protein